MSILIKINDRNKRLFWFLKQGTILDIENREQCDLYLQQVFSYGKTEDVKYLINVLPRQILMDSFLRVKRFFPKEVRGFWGKYLGNQ